jgi:hypothetical protein
MMIITNQSLRSLRNIACVSVVLMTLLLTGCGRRMHINTGIHLPPRARATISLNPESRNKVEMQNQGPGIVHALAIDSANRIDADLMMGPGSHYADGMRGMSRITLRNLSQFQTTVQIDLRQAEGYQMRIDPPSSDE